MEILLSCLAFSLKLLSFLELKLWARIPLQIGDSLSAVVLYSCVNFHKCDCVAFYNKVKFDQLFVQQVLRSRLTSDLQI